MTYNRPKSLKLLEKRILAQTYPRERLEWILIDDSPNSVPDFEPDPNSGLKTTYKRLPEKLKLGKKRNISNSLCSGNIIVYMDDDDYYPPTRVEHAVQRLTESNCLVAGSTILPILFVPEDELWVSGPFNKNHATANTFAFKKELLEITSFEDEATIAEERKFLKDYSIKMIQLEPKHTIICVGHDRNTYEKRQLIQGGKNPRFKHISNLNESQICLLRQISDDHQEATNNPFAPARQQAVNTEQSIASAIHFKIILHINSAESLAEKCINSIRNQKYDNFEAAVIINSDSQEWREKLVEAARGDSRFIFYANIPKANCYLGSLIHGVQILKPDAHDVLIVIDQDSILYGADSLEVIARIYKTKQCLLTYGGCARSSDNQIITTPLDTRIALSNSSRQARWLAPQLRTFKAGLLEFINPKDIHDSEGNLLTGEGESILLQSLFEISSHRSEYINTQLIISDVSGAGASVAISQQEATNIWSSYPYAPAPFIKLGTSSSHSNLSTKNNAGQNQALQLASSCTPMISIIMPTYARPQHLLKSIRIFQSQTWPSKQLLILDDSPQECKDAISIAESDPRIQYFYQATRESIGSKRKRLCEAAAGSLIAHFDDDDYYAPHYLNTMANKILENNFDFVKLRSWWSIYVPTKTYGFCNTSQLDKTRFYKISADGIKIYPNLFSKDQLNKIMYGYGFSYVYKKSILEKACHPESVNHGEDLMFINQCLREGISVGLLDDLEGIAIHAIHESNTSTCFAQHIINRVSVLHLTTVTQIPSGSIAGV